MLIQGRTREVQHLHKVLEDAGIKLASVATDILGMSVRSMLEAFVQGTTNPEVLAELVRGRLRAKLPVLQQALTGQFRRHHAFLLSELLAHLDDLEVVDGLSARIAEPLRPFAVVVAPLDAIPLVNQRVIEGVVSADDIRHPITEIESPLNTDQNVPSPNIQLEEGRMLRKEDFMVIHALAQWELYRCDIAK